jgi:hypothetical protein
VRTFVSSSAFPQARQYPTIFASELIGAVTPV